MTRSTIKPTKLYERPAGSTFNNVGYVVLEVILVRALGNTRTYQSFAEQFVADT